jgi:hypothetical protein
MFEFLVRYLGWNAQVAEQWTPVEGVSGVDGRTGDGGRDINVTSPAGLDGHH